MLIKKLPQNLTGRDFVVGDLHGCKPLLFEFLAHINFDPTKDRVISVGDLVDRGPDSYGTLQLLYEPWFHAVMGNHEDMMLQSLAQNSQAWFNIWVMNGGEWYNSLSPLERADLHDLCTNVVSKLPVLISVGDPVQYHVLHAELDDEVPLSNESLEHDIGLLASVQCLDGAIHLWGRYIFRTLYRQVLDDRTIRKFKRGAELGKLGRWADSDTLSTIYCGHSIMRQPAQCWKLTNIDTGAFATGRDPSFGLTLTNPATNEFWTVGADGVKKVNPIRVI